MPFILSDEKVRYLLSVAEKHNAKTFNFGVVIDKIGMTGHNIKEFIPCVQLSEKELTQKYIDTSEEVFKDTKTKDMWEL